MGVAGRGLRARQGLLGAFATTASGTVAMSVLGGVAGVIAARALGPYERGLLATAVVWSSVIGSIVAVGVPQAATYFVGREVTRRAQFAGSALAVSGLGGLGLAITGIAVSLVVGGDAKLPLIIAFAAGFP